MSSNLVSRGYPSGKTDADVGNYADASAETIQALVGKTRFLYEMLTGASATADESIAVPQNPDGLHGVNHSGPPYGVALKHPIAVSSHGLAAGFDRGRTYMAVGGGRPTSLIKHRLWQRPHPIPAVGGWTGPYQRAYILFRATNSEAATITLTFTVAPGTPDERAVAVALGTSVTSFSGGHADLWVPMRQGFREVYVTAASSSPTVTTTINALSFNQIAKLSHT